MSWFQKFEEGWAILVGLVWTRLVVKATERLVLMSEGLVIYLFSDGHNKFICVDLISLLFNIYCQCMFIPVCCQSIWQIPYMERYIGSNIVRYKRKYPTLFFNYLHTVHGEQRRWSENSFCKNYKQNSIQKSNILQNLVQNTGQCKFSCKPSPQNSING